MTIVHSQRIEASPGIVWETTLDVENWPEWAPTVTSAKILSAGPIAVGSEVLLTQPNMGSSVWTVRQLLDERLFVWSRRFLTMEMIARHRLEPAGQASINILEVDLKGALSWLFSPFLRRSILKNLMAENEALKRECEKTAYPLDGPSFA